MSWSWGCLYSHFYAGLTGSLLLVTSWAAAGSVEENKTFPSEALGGQGVYSLYLPEGYMQDAQRYPVVYLLHGAYGQSTDWLRQGSLKPTLDRMIAQGEIPPVIVVMPTGGDSYYIDSPTVGNYETSLLELVAHVDHTYRTIPERGARAIAGLSMGGYGSARFATKFPGRFAAAAIMSGALSESASAPENPTETQRKAFGDPVSERLWRQNSPYTQLESWTPETPPVAFYLTVGDDDTVTPPEQSLAFYRALEVQGVTAELRVTDGGHEWPVWSAALDDAFLFLFEFLEAGE